LILNKTTKIALNYVLGTFITALLLWSLYHQVSAQVQRLGGNSWWPHGTTHWLIATLLLLPLNLGIEAVKWRMLAGSAVQLSLFQSFKSILGGIAFSIITPNRIGEYPGRILFLKQKNSTRLISVSVLGSCSQLLTVLLFGVLGLAYYSLHYPNTPAFLLLAGCALLALGAGFFYWRFEHWAPWLERIRWLRRFKMYGQLLGRFTPQQQWLMLALALLRFAVFTLQYYLMLRWMGVLMPLADGFPLCALFFWAMAVIPSIALAELGIRGEVGLLLFRPYTTNTLGILAATFGLWAVNLVVPALIGSILLLRLRLLR
jgi:hypothetical protein